METNFVAQGDSQDLFDPETGHEDPKQGEAKFLEWRKLYSENGTLVYEGQTFRDKPYGAGISYYPDGSVFHEGIFGVKGLLCGKEYTQYGTLRFEGVYRKHSSYGPNWPEAGRFYDKDGNLIMTGLSKVTYGGVGYPSIVEPEKFERKAVLPHLNDLPVCMWEDEEQMKKKVNELEITIPKADHYDNLPDELRLFMEKWQEKALKLKEEYTCEWFAKLVETIFRYKGKRYRLIPETFGVPEDLMERMQKDLEKDLADIGCTNIASDGFLD